jgi:hypothetical protein
MTFYVHSEKNHGGLTVVQASDYLDALGAFDQAKLDPDFVHVFVQDQFGRRILSTDQIGPCDGPFPVLAPGLYDWCEQSEEYKPMMV